MLVLSIFPRNNTLFTPKNEQMDQDMFIEDELRQERPINSEINQNLEYQLIEEPIVENNAIYTQMKDQINYNVPDLDVPMEWDYEKITSFQSSGVPNYTADIALNPVNNLFIDSEKSSSIAKLQQISSLTYNDRGPISISSNSDFLSQASANGWPGNGTVGNPIIINGYNITGTPYPILIQNTDLYFKVTNNFLTQGSSGIYLTYVQNGEISGNVIYNNSNSGIWLWSCVNTNVSLNNITNNGLNGIRLVMLSHHNNISENVIYNHEFFGINFNMTGYNIVYKNVIYNNTNAGIFANYANDTIFSYNSFNINEQGIKAYESYNNSFLNNVFSNSNLYGLELIGYVVNSQISYNVFIGNNPSGTSQAKDDLGTNNNFTMNHWDDWTSPDLNRDNIVDTPYSIDGSTSNSDPLPLVYPRIPDDPVVITSNADFITHGFPGDGTIDNPYLIQNLLISNSTTYDLIRIENTTSHFKIANSFFNGLNGARIGINLLNVTNGIIESNQILNNLDQGIYGVNSTYNIFRYNNVSNNGYNGLRFGLTSNFNIITSNRLFNHGVAGIALSGSGYNTITNNSINDNALYGIYLFDNSGYNTLFNNSVFSNENGIALYTTSNYNNITGNQVYSNTRNGIWLNDGNYNEINENLLYNNSWDGIGLGWSQNNNLANNLVYNNSLAGITFLEANYNIIKNNTAYLNQNSGFHLDNSSFNVLMNNTAYKNSWAGFKLQYSSNNNTILYNTIYNNSNGYRIQSSNYNNFTKNIVYESGDHGFNLFQSSNNNILAENTAYKNSIVGIFLNQSSNCVLNSNFVYKNGWDGFYILNSDNNILRNNIGYNNSRHGVVVTVSNSNILEFNSVSNHTGNGFNFWGGSINNIIEDNTAYNNDLYGFYIHSSNNNNLINNLAFDNDRGYVLNSTSNYNTLSWNKAYNNSQAIRLEGSIYNQIVNNTLIDNDDGFGLHAGSQYNSVRNNTISGCINSGFYLWDADHNIIESNIVHNNTYGIWVSIYSENNTLLANSIYENMVGISLTSSLYGKISMNTVFNNIDRGISLNNANNSEILNNTVYNQAYGIKLSYSNENSIIGNEIYLHSQIGIVIVDWSQLNIIEKNRIYTNFYHGIYIAAYARFNLILKNTIENNNANGIELGGLLHYVLNITISQNWIRNNNGSGITSYFGYNVTIFGNSIMNHINYGINLLNSNSTSFLIQSNQFINNGIQVSDNGVNNLFQYNYWSDWLSPDSNGDYFVDDPYLISGVASNQDNFPMVEYYVFHQPIQISSNSEFLTQATKENWEGDGTFTNPFVIENYFITYANTTDLIYIHNTDVYFEIRNCLLLFGRYGIFFTNTTNAKILGNILRYNEWAGMYFYDSPQNQIKNNQVFHSNYGINLRVSSDFNILFNNTVYNSTYRGIMAYFSHYNIFEDNIVFHNYEHGIYLQNASNNILIGNLAYNNTLYGYFLHPASNNNILTNNTAYNNYHGFKITSSSNHNLLINNTSFENSFNGFEISLSINNTFDGNIAFNNQLYGFILHALAHNNTLSSNEVFDNKGRGIVIESSNNSLILNNSVFNHPNEGIYLLYSFYSNISKNSISNNSGNGIVLDQSNYNYLTHNNVSFNFEYGIYLKAFCDNNILINNQVYNNSWAGIILARTNNNTVDRNYVFDNLQTGIYVYFSNYSQVINNVVLNNYHGISLQNSNHSTVFNNTVRMQLHAGVYLYNSIDSILNNNTVNDNLDHGFNLYSSNNTQLINNTVFNNTYGLYIQFYSSNNDIIQNILANNTNYGVYLTDSTSFISVQFNHMIGNNRGGTSQAYDNGSFNVFANNYWNDWFFPDSDHDYIVDNPYIIDGGVNQDDNPLIIKSIDYLSDFSFNESDTGYSLLWTLSIDPPAGYTVYRNDFVIDSGQLLVVNDTIFVSLDSLVAGLYNFTCIVTNNLGFSMQDEVWITINAVPDIMDPVISSPPNLSFEEGSIGYSIIWIASDAHPWWVIVTKYDIINISNMTYYAGPWIGNDIEISLEGLSAGLYEFNCTLFDEAGNSNSDVVIVSVSSPALDITAPVILSPDPLEYEEGSTGHNLIWNITDNHPYAYRIAINETERIYCPWHGENITFNVDGLTIGIWMVNLTVWDLSGNFTTSIVYVTVIPEAPDLIAPSINRPADLIIAENMTGVIVWEVSDEHPGVYIIYRNNTEIYTSDSWTNGIIQYPFSSLTLGTWEFTLTIWDQAGNSISSIARVIVLPSSAFDFDRPEIPQMDDLVIIFGSSNNSVQLRLFDQHPSSYSIFLNGTEVIHNVWISPNVQVNFSLDGLGIGIYLINLTAWDLFGNTESRVFYVTVSGDTSPPTISSPPDIVMNEGLNNSLIWEVYDSAPSKYKLLFLPQGTTIELGSWSGENIEFDLSELTEGTYNVRCIVYDNTGNYAYDDVVITIESKSSGPSPGFTYPILFMLLILFGITRKHLVNRRKYEK
jgi:parallel beta-helix repeat protein